MDLDGFIKLGDAETCAATARANIAGKMADVATRIAQLGLIREVTIQNRLENIAKAFDIQWDKQAHDHLLKIRNLALQDAKRLEDEADKARCFTGRLRRLLEGDGSWTAIRDAWLAFEFFRGQLPASAAIKLDSVPVEPGAYAGASWRHPEQKQFDDLPENERNLAGIWKWARTRTLYPRPGTAAWQALAAYLDVMSEAAAARAEQIRSEADEAEREAVELARLDWDRLQAG